MVGVCGVPISDRSLAHAAEDSLRVSLGAAKPGAYRQGAASRRPRPRFCPRSIQIGCQSPNGLSGVIAFANPMSSERARTSGNVLADLIAQLWCALDIPGESANVDGFGSRAVNSDVGSARQAGRFRWPRHFRETYDLLEEGAASSVDAVFVDYYENRGGYEPMKASLLETPARDQWRPLLEQAFQVYESGS